MSDKKPTEDEMVDILRGKNSRRMFGHSGKQNKPGTAYIHTGLTNDGETTAEKLARVWKEWQAERKARKK